MHQPQLQPAHFLLESVRVTTPELQILESQVGATRSGEASLYLY